MSLPVGRGKYKGTSSKLLYRKGIPYTWAYIAEEPWKAKVKLEFGITLILKRKELPGINPHLPHSSPPIDPLVLVALFRSIPVLVPALLVVHYVSTLRY
jgi:hypothetical protein